MPSTCQIMMIKLVEQMIGRIIELVSIASNHELVLISYQMFQHRSKPLSKVLQIVFNTV